MAIDFPNINPVLLSLGDTPFKITWYSLSYVVGILLAHLYIKYLNRTGKIQPSIELSIIDGVLTYLILGIIIGGRLGYVIFYDLNYNLANPLNIIRTWEGGMSFHGGLIGVIIASFIYSYIYNVNYFRLIDLLSCAAPIGLFFGRIANFINGELYGRETDASFGVIFPGQQFPRHASQLYESFSEGLLIWIILLFLYRFTKIQTYYGMLSGVFLLLYAFFRGLIENYREPDAHIGFVIYNYTMGQLLSFPMIIIGLSIILYSLNHKVK